MGKKRKDKREKQDDRWGIGWPIDRRSLRVEEREGRERQKAQNKTKPKTKE